MGDRKKTQVRPLPGHKLPPKATRTSTKRSISTLLDRAYERLVHNEIWQSVIIPVLHRFDTPRTARLDVTLSEPAWNTQPTSTGDSYAFINPDMLLVNCCDRISC